MFVTAKKITSPTGCTVSPKIIEREYGGKIYKEAHYYDPNSGIFFQKGIISVTDKETKQVTDINSPVR